MSPDEQLDDFIRRLNIASGFDFKKGSTLRSSLGPSTAPFIWPDGTFRVGVFGFENFDRLEDISENADGLALVSRISLPGVPNRFLHVAVTFSGSELDALIRTLKLTKSRCNAVHVCFYGGGIYLDTDTPKTGSSSTEWSGSAKIGFTGVYHANTAHANGRTALETEYIAHLEQLLPSRPPQNLSKSDAVSGPRLERVPSRIQSVLERKRQVILYGPPGTGKTYWAQRTARNLAALDKFGVEFESLSDQQKWEIVDHQHASGLVRMCCFHPGYGYEDFLEGYRPQATDGQIAFELRDGIFKNLCRDATANPDRKFYLVIDEINRGDIPRIFGELLTVLERDKRNSAVVLPVSQQTLRVPENVYLIGTMNTADRSISLLDAALRRRFGFIELMPDGSKLGDRDISGIPLQTWFNELNLRIREYVGRDARNLQIGHSYLMQDGRPISDFQTLKQAIRDDVIPLISEYCYEDFTALQNILGRALVDIDQSRIQEELFDDGQEKNLIQALLEFMPEVPAATTAPESSEPEATGDGDDAANEATES